MSDIIKVCVDCESTKVKAYGRCHNHAIRHWRNKNKDAHRQYMKDYFAKNREKIYLQSKNSNLQKRYGITLDDYHGLLMKQNNLCAICRKPSKKKALAVDHDHTTGAVRGLLCDNCNRGIGLLGESSEILINAIEYLRK